MEKKMKEFYCLRAFPDGTAIWLDAWGFVALCDEGVYPQDAAAAVRGGDVARALLKDAERRGTAAPAPSVMDDWRGLP